jgi:vancomycin resistance protein VanJ
VSGSASGVVIRCDAKEHRVRLDSKRFWAAARCPVCQTPVDRFRIRRVVAWGLRYVDPQGASRLARWTVRLTYLYCLMVVGTWVLLWGLGDRWWLGTIILFGPRWVLVLPLLPLIGLAAWQRRKMLIPLAACGVIVVFPIMGGRLNLGSTKAAAATPDSRLRVMTFNAQNGYTLTRAIWEIIGTVAPDIAAFQECSREMFTQLAEIPGWHTHQNGGLCFASRFPIDTVYVMERASLESIGGSGLVARYVLRTPHGPLQVTNLHLDTPRQGLEPISSGRFSIGLRKLREKTLVRDIESRRARRWVEDGPPPRIVVGDFNLPVESVIYQRYWSDLSNAFNEVGHGFGRTRFNGWIKARIDHVLHSPDLAPVRAFVGPELGSDHRPMIVDLEWTNGDTTIATLERQDPPEPRK